MKSVKNVLLGLGVVFAVVLFASFITKDSGAKIGYVRSVELIYGYDGTKAAQAKFTKQKEAWQANLDTLKAEFNRSLAAFNEGQAKMSKAELKRQRQLLASQESQLQQYAQAITEQSEKQDSEVMQSVLNQINSFTEAYGKAQGYDFILGTSSDGNVLYGKGSLDITEELLEALNKQYHGQ